MTPRRTFAFGALVGASFAAGVLVDAVCDVTGRLACWVAPWQRQAYATRHPLFRVGPCTGQLRDPADS